MKLVKKHLWKVLYRSYSFHFDPLTNMAATGNSCFRLVDFYKSSSLKLLGQNELKFGGSTYGRFCIKFPQSRMKGERHRLSSISLQTSDLMCLKHKLYMTRSVITKLEFLSF
jgi:hypothetical protein